MEYFPSILIPPEIHRAKSAEPPIPQFKELAPTAPGPHPKKIEIAGMCESQRWFTTDSLYKKSVVCHGYGRFCGAYRSDSAGISLPHYATPEILRKQIK